MRYRTFQLIRSMTAVTKAHRCRYLAQAAIFRENWGNRRPSLGKEMQHISGSWSETQGAIDRPAGGRVHYRVPVNCWSLHA